MKYRSRGHQNSFYDTPLVVSQRRCRTREVFEAFEDKQGGKAESHHRMQAATQKVSGDDLQAIAHMPSLVDLRDTLPRLAVAVPDKTRVQPQYMCQDPADLPVPILVHAQVRIQPTKPLVLLLGESELVARDAPSARSDPVEALQVGCPAEIFCIQRRKDAQFLIGHMETGDHPCLGMRLEQSFRPLDDTRLEPVVPVHVHHKTGTALPDRTVAVAGGAKVHRIAEQLDERVMLLEFLGHFPRSVRRTIVAQDEFIWLSRLRQHTLDGLPQEVPVVIVDHRNGDGHQSHFTNSNRSLPFAPLAGCLPALDAPNGHYRNLR